MTQAYLDYAFDSPALRGLVCAAWGQAYHASADLLPGLIAPDAHIEIVFQVGAPCRIASGDVETPSLAAMVYGLRHGAQRLRAVGDNRMTALRLKPAVASWVLRADLADCWDRPVALADLIGREADDLLDAIASRGLEDSGGVLEAWLLSRLGGWGADQHRQVNLQSRLLWEVGERSTAELAEDLGVTARTLRRQCRTHAGLSPKQLIMSGRILRACDLLRRPDRVPLVEVAGRLGFNDQAAFTNAFRRYLGLTPTALRAEPLVFYETPR